MARNGQSVLYQSLDPDQSVDSGSRDDNVASRNNKIVASSSNTQSPQDFDMSNPPRKWLMDRINGTSKYGDGERPVCPCCWVPPPVGWFPGLCEDNSCCRCWGNTGGYKTERARCFMMHAGFLCNLIACLMTVYACLAITVDFEVLTRTSFGSVTLTEVNGKFTEKIEVDIGLRAIALNNPVTGAGEVVVRFDQFCDLATDGLERYMNPEDCDACNDISTNMVISTVMAAVTFLPSFFTDVTRMYSGYDVNCQKFFATIFAFFTILLSLNTLFTYRFLCADKFYEGVIPFDSEGNALPPGTPDSSAEFLIDFEYRWGWGIVFLTAGTVFKFFDVFLHCCLRTPPVTRDRKEQIIYEKVKDDDFP